MMRPQWFSFMYGKHSCMNFRLAQRAGLVRQQRVIRIDVLNRPVKHSALGAVDQNVDRLEMSDSFIDNHAGSELRPQRRRRRQHLAFRLLTFDFLPDLIQFFLPAGTEHNGSPVGG